MLYNPFLLGLLLSYLLPITLAQDVPTSVVQAGIDLLDANHILHFLDVVDAFGHISVRNPANASQFLMLAHKCITQMPNNIGETSLVFAGSVFPSRTAASVSASILVIGCMIHRIWPRRLTYALAAFMQETERLYYDAVEAGELPRDGGTEEKLLSLQKKVAENHEASLRNSSSMWKALGDFFRGRSITLLQCADEVQSFKNHIEILKVTQLRTNLNSTNPGTVALATSLRRRLNGAVAA